MNMVGASLAEHFGGLEDPRVAHLTDYKLLDIMIALCAIISGAEPTTSWPSRATRPPYQQDMASFFHLAQQNNFQKVTYTYARTANKDHERVEVRQCWAVSGQDSFHLICGCPASCKLPVTSSEVKYVASPLVTR